MMGVETFTKKPEEKKFQSKYLLPAWKTRKILIIACIIIGLIFIGLKFAGKYFPVNQPIYDSMEHYEVNHFTEFNVYTKDSMRIIVIEDVEFTYIDLYNLDTEEKTYGINLNDIADNSEALSYQRFFYENGFEKLDEFFVVDAWYVSLVLGVVFLILAVILASTYKRSQKDREEENIRKEDTRRKSIELTRTVTKGRF